MGECARRQPGASIRRRNMPMCLLAVFLLFLLATATSWAGECALPELGELASQYDWNRRSEKNACLRRINDIPADYFVLSLSYSPRFCRESARDGRTGAIRPHHAFQCAGSNTFGWVVHGLWPQARHPRICRVGGAATAMHPRYCQGDDVGPTDPQVIREYMCVLPSEFLLQGGWEKHGTCGGFASAEAYFAKTRQLFAALVLPEEDLRPPRLFQVLRRDNPQLRGVWMGYEAGEIRICYDKKWRYIDCPR